MSPSAVPGPAFALAHVVRPVRSVSVFQERENKGSLSSLASRRLSATGDAEEKENR